MTFTANGSDSRTASAALARGRSVTAPALRAAIDSLPRPMRHVAGYHLGWWDEDGSPVTAGGGKSIRPALALAAARAVTATAGGGADPRPGTCRGVGTDGADSRAVPAAVAVELVHNFSLLHDDVMDRDVVRRHRPTAWSVFGLGAAILAGDVLLVLALDVLAASGHPRAQEGVRMLAGAVVGLVDGQSADVAFEDRADVGPDECLRMARAKTGTLLGCACALGGLFAGASSAQVEHLRGFGEDLGVAFQLADDLLGIWGDPGVTGKPVHADLGRRKKSLPVVAALASGTPEGRELAALYGRDGPLRGAELSRAAQLLDAAGARAWCRDQADDHLARAFAHLREAVPAGAGEELEALARLAARRDR